jgi:hypothetical protein
MKAKDMIEVFLMFSPLYMAVGAIVIISTFGIWSGWVAAVYEFLLFFGGMAGSYIIAELLLEKDIKTGAAAAV